MDGIWGPGGYSLIYGFRTKDSHPLMVESNHVCLDHTTEVHRLGPEWNLNDADFIIRPGES